MLYGIDYAHSEEKRRFDKYAIRFARPFALAAQYAIAFQSNSDPIFLQTRVGENGDLFNAYKLRTLMEDAVTPTGKMTTFMRRSGLDELIQYKNILEGDMSMVARRPLTPQEYDEAFDDVPLSTVEDYLKIVIPTRPGLVSSFVIATHLGEIEDHAMRLQRLEMDIKDVKEGSYSRDKQLFWTAVNRGLTNKMKRGAIRPTETA